MTRLRTHNRRALKAGRRLPVRIRVRRGMRAFGDSFKSVADQFAYAAVVMRRFTAAEYVPRLTPVMLFEGEVRLSPSKIDSADYSELEKRVLAHAMTYVPGWRQQFYDDWNEYVGQYRK